jgi:arylsulfatase A-like enzyme
MSFLPITLPLLLAAAPWASAQGTGGNVCVIVLDDVAPGMLSSFDAAAVASGRPSQAPASTPVIDALLAGQGISFDRAWSCPTCSPSRAAMLTGRFGLRSGIGQVVPPRATRPCPGLETDVELLPGLLRGAQPAYASGAVGKWHVADQLQLAANPQHPLGGTTQPWFDRFAGTWFNLGAMALQPYQSSGYYVWEKNYATRIEWLGASPCPAGAPPCNVDMDVNITPLDYPSVDTIEDAIVLARELPQPWFLWVAPHAAHTPFHPLPAGLPADTCRGVAAPGPSCVYPGLNSAQSDSRCMLEALDHQLGRLFCELDFATTTVILVADNGWGQHVVVAPYSAARSKASVYEGGVEVPFVVGGPRRTAHHPGAPPPPPQGEVGGFGAQGKQ